MIVELVKNKDLLEKDIYLKKNTEIYLVYNTNTDFSID